MKQEKARRSRAMNEFIAAFGTLVRHVEESGELTDSRLSEAMKLAEKLLAMGEREFANMICVDPVVGSRLLDPAVTAAALSVYPGLKDDPRLRTDPSHPVACLLTRLQETVDGRKVYSTMVAVLEEAKDEPTVKAYILCKPQKEKK